MHCSNSEKKSTVLVTQSEYNTPDNAQSQSQLIQLKTTTILAVIIINKNGSKNVEHTKKLSCILSEGKNSLRDESAWMDDDELQKEH